MEKSVHFEVQPNAFKFMETKGKFIDGVQLTDDERQYMLPHFTMLVVGKPGSGKTTVIKQLLMN
jgi:HrpA-like RNA helicase